MYKLTGQVVDLQLSYFVVGTCVLDNKNNNMIEAWSSCPFYYFICVTSDESRNKAGDHRKSPTGTTNHDTSPSTTEGEISEQNQQGQTLPGS